MRCASRRRVGRAHRSWRTLRPLAALLALAGLCLADERPAALSKQELLALAKEIEPQVAALRGWEFKHPVKTDVRSEDQLRKFIETKVFEEQYGGGLLERTEAFLRIVGLIPPGCELRKTVIDVLLNQVGGFYDPETKTFYMMQREGVGFGKLLNRVLIAHELCHALDDQHLDLDKLMKSRELTEDWSLAMGAVVEGSATVLMTQYMAREQASGDYDLEELSRVVEAEMERAQVFTNAPRYFSTLLANYLCGMQFLVAGRMELLAMDDVNGVVGKHVKQAISEPPLSSEQILHPEKYWDDEQRDPPRVFDDEQIEALLSGPSRHVIHKNTVGELLCALLTSEDQPLDMMAASLPGFWTNEAAAGWGGDRFFLIAEGSDLEAARKNLAGPLRAAWLTAWDTPGDREVFMEDYAAYRPQAQRGAIKLGKAGAVFLYGFDEKERREVEARLQAARLRLSHNGKATDL